MTLKSSLKQKETKRNGRTAAFKREIIELANNNDNDEDEDDDVEDDVEEDVVDDEDVVEEEQLEWSAAQSLVQMNSKQEKQRRLGVVITAATGVGTAATAAATGITAATAMGTAATAATTTTVSAAAGRCNS